MFRLDYPVPFLRSMTTTGPRKFAYTLGAPNICSETHPKVPPTSFSKQTTPQDKESGYVEAEVTAISCHPLQRADHHLLHGPTQGGQRATVRCGHGRPDPDIHAIVPRFPIEDPQLQAFICFLKSMEGRCRSHEQACVIATSMSKFLKHAGPRRLDWDKLLQPALVKAYTDHLSTMEASGVDGQVTFLQRVYLALKFF